MLSLLHRNPLKSTRQLLSKTFGMCRQDKCLKVLPKKFIFTMKLLDFMDINHRHKTRTKVVMSRDISMTTLQDSSPLNAV